MAGRIPQTPVTALHEVKRIKLRKRKRKRINKPRKKVVKTQASPLQINEMGPAKLASPEGVLYEPSNELPPNKR